MTKIEVVLGDITTQDVDVIVNAANSSLLGGGGVDGAIHKAAGPRLLAACQNVRSAYPDGLSVGEAVLTGAGNLPCKAVVHTVGPNRHRGETDPQSLASCFTRSIEVASAFGARSIAFPAISSGIYGWDIDDVAGIALQAAQDAISDGLTDGIDLIRFVIFDENTLAAFYEALGYTKAARQDVSEVDSDPAAEAGFDDDALAGGVPTADAEPEPAAEGTARSVLADLATSAGHLDPGSRHTLVLGAGLFALTDEIRALTSVLNGRITD